MTLPASFPISWQQICNEFGLAYTSSWPSAFYGKGGAPASGNLSFSDFLGRSNGPQYPTLFGSSSNYAGAPSQNVAWPAGHATNDIGILLVATNNQALPATPTGCTAIYATGGFGTAGAVGGIRLHAYWIRATSGSMPNIATGDSGNINVAKLLVFRGCRENGSPLDSTAAYGINNVSNPFFVSPGTAFNSKCLAIGVAAVAKDAADTDIMTAISSLGSNLQNASEIVDFADATSNGAGLVGYKAEVIAGMTTVGATQVTLDAAMNWEAIHFLLAPKAVAGTSDYYIIRSSQTFNAPYAGNVKLHAFGGGAGCRNAVGGTESGGGGAYAGKNSQAIASGAAIVCTIAAQVSGTSGAMGTGGDATIAISAVTQALAKGASGINGGQAASCTGDVKYSGGNGAAGSVWIDPEPPNSTYRAYGGAGGPAGSTGAGQAGTAGWTDTYYAEDGVDGASGSGLKGTGYGGHAPSGQTGGAAMIIIEMIP